MTQKEAYIEGFCKTAEAYGVDPRQLMKEAGLASEFMLDASKRLRARQLKSGFRGAVKNHRYANRAVGPAVRSYLMPGTGRDIAEGVFAPVVARRLKQLELQALIKERMSRLNQHLQQAESWMNSPVASTKALGAAEGKETLDLLAKQRKLLAKVKNYSIDDAVQRMSKRDLIPLEDFSIPAVDARGGERAARASRRAKSFLANLMDPEVGPAMVRV